MPGPDRQAYLALLALGLWAAAPPAAAIDLRSLVPANPAGYITPACYTRALDKLLNPHNPCYACHTGAHPPNYTADATQQLAYVFPGPAAVNPWSNFFADRRLAIAAMPDAAILAWVRTDNYLDGRRRITLAAELDRLPAEWDVDGDGEWSGYRPDIWLAFDADGFDRDPGGEPTGWRAFSYYPLPGGGWPTNGAASEIAIRLPTPFRTDASGRPDLAIYKINLAIVEAAVRRIDVPLPPTDERVLGVDLDQDGRLGQADKVVFGFERPGRNMSYVGAARALAESGALHLAPGLFPEGTEFVHFLRDLDVLPTGEVTDAARIKEIDYARKRGWRSYFDLREISLADHQQARDHSERLRQVFGDAEHGLGAGQGWILQGFIEDAAGRLRPQSFGESLACVGCHGGIGRTTDSIFAFSSKETGPAASAGWATQTVAGLARLPDRDGEYRRYLERNGAGDEFRSNTEAQARFFHADGSLDEAAADRLADRIGELVVPSAERALALDKAYRMLVEEQSFERGRVPLLAPLEESLLREVEPGTPTGIALPVVEIRFAH